jgi:hypothetical protein
VKTASFTVRATTDQAARWNRASEAGGHRSAGTWLAAAADAYLRVRAKAAMPLPLAWRRFGRFRVVLMDGAEIEARAPYLRRRSASSRERRTGQTATICARWCTFLCGKLSRRCDQLGSAVRWRQNWRSCWSVAIRSRARGPS